MFEALILNWIGTLFWEKSAIEIKSIWNTLKVHEKIHISNMFQMIISLLILSFTRNFKFVFDLRLVFLFLVLIISSILFNIFVIKAIEKADRSTNGLLSILAIPLLLVSDIFLKYDITTYHIIWIIFIVTTLLTISLKWTINLKWAQFTLLTQVFAFINIMIFKFIITNYASTEILNIIMSFVLYIWSFALIFKKSDRFEVLSKVYDRKYIKFWVFWWLGWAFNSMWFMFGPASVITALKRILSMFWWVVMWKIYFHEERFFQKMASVWVIAMWVVIMNFPIIVTNKALLTSVNTALLIKWDVKWYSQALKESNIDLSKNFRENAARAEQLYSIN